MNADTVINTAIGAVLGAMITLVILTIVSFFVPTIYYHPSADASWTQEHGCQIQQVTPEKYKEYYDWCQWNATYSRKPPEAR